MRFRIVVALAGLLTLGVFSLAATSLIAHGGAAPALGWTEAADGDVRVVQSVDPDGPAAGRLRVGDRLVAVDGDTLVARYGTGFVRWSLPIDAEYGVRVERDGEEREVRLTVGSGPRRLRMALVYFCVSLVWCAVGLFVGYARPDDAVARLAFASALATGGVYVQVGMFPGLPGGIVQPLHMVLGYHFFYRFPGGVRRGAVSRGLLWLFYAWGVVTFALRQPPKWELLTEGPGAAAAWAARHGALLDAAWIAAIALMLPLMTASVILIATTYRRLDDPERRRRIRWVMVASAVALSPNLLWAVLALANQIALPGPSPVPPRVWFVVDLLTNTMTVLIPLAVAYAVLRHRVFDIAVVVRRGLQYVLARRALQALLAVPTVALIATAVVNRDRTIAELAGESAGYLWLMVALALSLRYREPLGAWLDRRFFRGQYDREQVLMGLLEDLRRLTAPSDVAHLVRVQVDFALHPEDVRVWFDGDPDPPSPALLARMADDAVESEAPVTHGDDLPEGIRVAVPLRTGEERLQGVLLLGEKRSEEPYSADDLSLLGMVARQAAVVRENLLLRERIGVERRIRSDVLARLRPDRADLVRECPACGSCYDATVETCERDGHALDLTVPVSRVVADRYRVDLRIGRGGMGVVYEARDLRLGRPVAIKLLLGPAFDQVHALRRFRREARAVARVHHPNVVGVFDYGRLEGQGAFLVMERIHGTTLREELVRRGSLPARAASRWIAPLLEGLAAVHEEGVIHRDLKPENVVRARSEHGPPVVKILDFGIAKVRAADTATDHLTASGAVVGTLGYMSPEQLRGAEVDARTDVFSVGVMTVEALTGCWPFRGGTYSELLAAIVLDPYRFPDATPAGAALDAVLQRCLAKDPGDRFPDVPAVRDALVPALEAYADGDGPGPGAVQAEGSDPSGGASGRGRGAGV